MDCSKNVMGIEFGSTRIKAVLVNEAHQPIASGDFEWENSLKDGIWTYSLAEVETGLQTCFGKLKEDFKGKFGQDLTEVGAIGISGMMHGYLPFDKEGNQLAEFRTWRNTMTKEAAEILTDLFSFNVPQRWSIAHLGQAILNQESHVGQIAYLTTLAGYVHWKLTGRKAVGVGEASGIFPIDSATGTYQEQMVEKFEAFCLEKGLSIKLSDILPQVLTAGEEAGRLTEEGALFLDPTGMLKAGIPFAPCEGDAGTGMVATNSVGLGTGNVSAGTSDFAMVVVDHMPGVHREIDMVTTPDGKAVAMVHCNNCTSDINAWVGLLYDFTKVLGMEVSKGELFTRLFREALKGDKSCSGLMSFNYFSGEGVTDLDEGRPVFARMPDAGLNVADFMRTNLYSALATLKIGLDILTETEQVKIDRLTGHGGFFKTPVVGQTMLSAAAAAPVYTLETAGEGGPYGMALLASYMMEKEENQTLDDYLTEKVFRDAETTCIMASDEDIEGFNQFLIRYKRALAMEKAAVESL